ncbi:MAG: histidinol-phosphatase, partial [Thermomicrobiaceae bacterium]|nr:histidinol-phosphatase [Thermomicrobiaceae bacterium]
MTNREIASHLRRFADLLEIKGENAFRINAYRRAADAIEQLDVPAEDLVQTETLTAVPGVGPGIAAAVTELVRTGRYGPEDELLGEVPATVLTLLEVPGL